MSIYDQLRSSTSPLLDKFKNAKQITIQTPVETKTSSGGLSVAWSVVSTVSAIVLPASGQEREQAQRMQTEVSHKILTLHSKAPNITSKDRIIFDGRVFNVVYPLNIAEGDMWLSIMCMEGVAT